MEIILREWQKDAYEAFKKNGYNGILKVGTGKGKTVFAIYCIKQFMDENPDSRTCIIVPTINLMFQWRKELLKFLDLEEDEVSLFYGQEKDISGKIVIYVVNSAVNHANLKKAHLLKPFDFMVADECHHYGSILFSKIFEIHTNRALGLSATPEREKDKGGTEKIIEGLGPKVFELNHLDDPKAIPNFVIWSILVGLTDEEKNKYEENSFEIVKLNRYFLVKFGISHENEDYIDKIKELANKKNPAALKMLSLWSKQSGIKYQAKNKLNLVKELVNMEKESKIIVFNERIEFTKKICEELDNEFSLDLFMIHSGLSKKEVQDKLNQFRDSKKGVLIAPRLIDEGYDVPDASVAIIVSFTKSARQMIQRDGRILRKTPEKENATRYSLVIEGIEEEKYFWVLRNSEMGGKAIEGEWLRYDSENNSFSDAERFKQGFLNFDKITQYHKDQFKEWVVKKLDYYENNLKRNDVEEIEKRFEFFNRFLDVVKILSEEYPNRWKELEKKLEKTHPIKKIKYIYHASEVEKNRLKKELRQVTSIISLPNSIFNAIMRYIENEPFDLDSSTEEFIITLTDRERPDIWPENIYGILQAMRNNLNQTKSIQKFYEKGEISKSAWRKHNRYGKLGRNIKRALKHNINSN